MADPVRIPEQGWSRERVIETLEQFRANDVPWREARTWAYVYDPGPAAEEVIKTAFSMYLTENALDPTVFPSTLRLENELVAMAAAHLRGDEHVVGNFTSGGTESIILAVKTARDRARALRPDVREPELVLPTTAHAAFHKACHYLDVKPVLTEVDPKTFKADVEAMRRAIGPNTILLVGSAVSYAHGVVDPIEEIGRLALEHDLLLHVDGCMGGFLLPYFRRCGAPVPRFEFDVPGVTSISMDFHKYAFAPKGASVVAYRDAGLRRFQYFACAEWPGYALVNPGVLSSKSAGPLAATWAVLQGLGDAGYLELAARARAGTARLVAGIEAIPGLRVLGQPDFCLVAFGADPQDPSAPGPFQVADALRERGWYVQPQLGHRACPDSVHLSLGPENASRVEELLADLRLAAEEAKDAPRGELSALVDGWLAGRSAPPTPEELGQLLAVAGLTPGGELPARTAPLLEALSALPRALVGELLIDYLGGLFLPQPALATA